TRALRWRAAAPGARPRLGAPAAHPLSRRAHREPRSDGGPGDRARDRRDPRVGDTHRHDDAPPGPRAAHRRRDPLPARRAPRRADTGRTLLRRPPLGRSAAIPQRRASLEHRLKTRARIAACVLAAVASLQVAAANPFITVASTTSTEQSGLFKHLLPAFT